MQRLFGRRTKTKLPTTETLLKPRVMEPENVRYRLNEYLNTAKHYHDRDSRPLMPLQTKDTIRVWSKDRWQPAKPLPQDAQPKEPRSYKIHIPSGTILRRNCHTLLKTREGEIFHQELPDFNVDDGHVEQVLVRQNR